MKTISEKDDVISEKDKVIERVRNERDDFRIEATRFGEKFRRTLEKYTSLKSRVPSYFHDRRPAPYSG